MSRISLPWLAGMRFRQSESFSSPEGLSYVTGRRARLVHECVGFKLGRWTASDSLVSSRRGPALP